MIQLDIEIQHLNALQASPEENEETVTAEKTTTAEEEDKDSVHQQELS